MAGLGWGRCTTMRMLPLLSRTREPDRSTTSTSKARISDSMSAQRRSAGVGVSKILVSVRRCLRFNDSKGYWGRTVSSWGGDSIVEANDTWEADFFGPDFADEVAAGFLPDWHYLVAVFAQLAQGGNLGGRNHIIVPLLIGWDNRYFRSGPPEVIEGLVDVSVEIQDIMPGEVMNLFQDVEHFLLQKIGGKAFDHFAIVIE